MQGDLPTVDPASVRAALAPLADPGRRHRDLAAVIVRDDERTNPNVVKVVGTPVGRQRSSARSISPAPPRPMARGRSTTTSASTPIAARRSTRFVALPPSPLEKREKLEQLRALEAGMRIDVGDRRRRAARRRHARTISRAPARCSPSLPKLTAKLQRCIMPSTP